MSMVYTLDGDILPLVLDEYPGDIFFRKMITSDTERVIASLLLNTNVPNVVRVYRVTDTHYDAELLVPYHDDDTSQASDIRAALDQLHSLGIVYLDLKRDNMGYSTTDNCWKLFDFDGCGTLLKHDVWDNVPPSYKTYLMYKDMIKPGEDLVSIDWLIYQNMYKETPKT